MSSSSSSSSSSSAAGQGTVAGAGHEAGAKAVVLKIFGPDLGEKLALAAGRGKSKEYRDVLEPTDTVVQCERSGHPYKPDETKCYLCGFVIPSRKRPEDELRVECEHILPVTEARWFLDLYMTKRQATDDWTKKAIALEYDQSHRVCNQAKSNFSFIRTDEVGNAHLSEVGIRKILKNIQVRARGRVFDYATEPDMQAIMQGIADTIETRYDAVKDRVNAIVAHINSQPAAVDPVNEAMILLLRTALIADPGTLSTATRAEHDKWYETKQKLEKAGVTPPTPEELFQTFLAKTYEEYPQIHPDSDAFAIDKSLFPENVLTKALVGQTLRAFFDRYASQTTEPDPSGKFLVAAVTYGLYSSALSAWLAGQRTSDIPTIISVYDRMTEIYTNYPRVFTIFPEPPKLPQEIQTRREIAKQNEDRKNRTLARGLALQSPKTTQNNASWTATRYLAGLEDYIAKVLVENGTSSELASDTAKKLYDRAHQRFVESYSEGPQHAREYAANELEGALVLATFSTPETGTEVTKKIVNYVLENQPAKEPGQSNAAVMRRDKISVPFDPSIGRGRRTYRKSKHAKSSQRTRRGRYSGQSKRWKKQSSRKSRTGK